MMVEVDISLGLYQNAIKASEKEGISPDAVIERWIILGLHVELDREEEDDN